MGTDTAALCFDFKVKPLPAFPSNDYHNPVCRCETTLGPHPITGDSHAKQICGADTVQLVEVSSSCEYILLSLFRLMYSE